MYVIRKTFGFIGKAFLILLVIGLIGMMIDNDKTPGPKVLSNTSSATKETDYASRIRPYAYDPYTTDFYPQTVAEFGPRLPEIEQHKQMALRKAIDTGKCDFAEVVELSTKSTLTNLIYWVDCENGQRFWFYEDDF